MPKARLVARGDMQDLDYAYVFTTIDRFTTLRVLLALAFYHDLENEQMDVVTTAFLNADVVSNVYMEYLSDAILYALLHKHSFRLQALQGPLWHPRRSLPCLEHPP